MSMADTDATTAQVTIKGVVDIIKVVFESELENEVAQQPGSQLFQLISIYWTVAKYHP